MPIMVECDGGCGRNVGALGEFERFGYADYRYYCPDCADLVREYLANIDALHDSLAKKWRSGVEIRRKAILKTLSFPKASLPDAS